MKRREFIKNSALMLGFASLLTGCIQKEDLQQNKIQVTRKPFGNITLPLIALGGLMSYPVKDKKITSTDFKNAVNFAMEHGMNYFDTAYMYDYEITEKMLAKALKKYPRENYIFTNKISVYSVKDKKDIRNLFEQQLKRCNVDYFDNYSIFNIGRKNIDNYRKNKMYDEVLKLKEEGKIKNIGFSGPTNPQVFKEVLEEHKWDFCQLKMNYLDWKDRGTDKLYEIIEKAAIPTIVLEPLRGGTLCEFPQEFTQKMNETTKGATQASFALRWAASKKMVASVLCDIDDLKQLEENVSTFSNYKDFNAQEEKIIQDITKFIDSKNIVKCNSCKHCVSECPQDIPISEIITMYNRYKISANKNKAQDFISSYTAIKETKRADKCINCRRCMECHRKINIPEVLKEIHSTFLTLETK